MTDLDTGRMRVRCERGHFITSTLTGHIARASIGPSLSGVTADCSACGPQVPVVQTFDGETIGWAWEDIFGDWDGLADERTASE